MSGYDLEHEKALLKREDTTAGLSSGWLLALFELDRLHHLFCDLAPGGSEFADNPDRCAAWVKRELSTSLEAAVKAHGQANDLRRELSEANQRIEVLEELREEAAGAVVLMRDLRRYVCAVCGYGWAEDSRECHAGNCLVKQARALAPCEAKP